MSFIRQTTNENCGQAVLAMAYGLSLEEVKQVLPPKFTTPEQMRKAVEKLGKCPRRGVLVYVSNWSLINPKYHWVYNNKKWYDPARGVFKTIGDRYVIKDLIEL